MVEDHKKFFRMFGLFVWNGLLVDAAGMMRLNYSGADWSPFILVVTSGITHEC